MKRIGMAIFLCLFICVPMLFVACADMTPTQKGAAGGAAVGAVAGAVVGGSTRATLIGAGVGALGGALLNDAAHKDKK